MSNPALNLPLDKRTDAQCEALARIHEATAAQMESKQEPAMAEQFRALARKYSDELKRRSNLRGQIQPESERVP